MIIKGTVNRIFAEKDSGFKILVMDVADMRSVALDKRNPDFPNSITVVGVMKGVEKGYVIEVDGEWEHRENGKYWPWQWKVSDFSVCEFETPYLLRKFLSELPSVGTELASRIMALFSDPVDVIENSPERLTMVKGVTNEKAQQIRREFLAQKEKKSLGAFLQKYGLKNEEIGRIANFYGGNALQVIRSNPYCLCDDRFASFRLCDRIAKDRSIPADDERRLGCAIRNVLSIRAGSKGHTYLTEDVLLEESNAFFHDNAVIECSFTKDRLESKLTSLIANGQIAYEEGRYYHPDRYRNENDTASILLRRTKSGQKFMDADDSLLEECLEAVQQEIGIRLDEVQLNAVKTAIHSPTMVITGGPGCGKTTLLNTYIRTIEMLSKRMGKAKPTISLAAPTGMASKRMASSTGREARTIHKLFDIHFDSLLGETDIKKVDSDIIVLDEVSMLDIDIMAHILRCTRDETSLILVGDRDQIPSIGPGNVLADIIESGTVPVVRLVHSYRHGSRKTILMNATKINTGEEELITNRSDFVVYKVPDKATDKDCRRLRTVTERVFCEEFLAGGQDPYRVQVISPLRSKTQASVDELNIVLQRIANPEISKDEQITFGKVVFRKGDKVMQVSNDYDKGVFNGDVGVIRLVSANRKLLRVDFQGLVVDYAEHEFEQLKHAFATTVHKAQGSQYPVVIMVITNFHSMMLLRNLFYTGVTRAMQRLILIGDEEAIKYAIRNTKGTKRLSSLCGRLKKG